MNKIERVDHVLEGKETDFPPISLWYHFGVQHASGVQFARICLEYFHHYDLDFLKVMNDYYYPPPEGMDSIRSKKDLQKIRKFNVEESGWKEQFKALGIIADNLKNTAYFLDTVFDPWQTLRRNMAGENIEHLMADEPEAMLEALDLIADNLIDYCKKSLAIGTTGIFMSVPAAKELISRENFLKFVKPFALKVFTAISDLGKMNTAHIHGDDLYFDDCLDFPVRIFNWWDRGPGGPSLHAVKEKISGCVMGGIDHKIVSGNSRDYLRTHVQEGRLLGGDTRFLMANGCSIDTWTDPRAIRTLVAASREKPNK